MGRFLHSPQCICTGDRTPCSLSMGALWGPSLGATPSRGRGWLNGLIHRRIPRRGQIRVRGLFERIDTGNHRGASESPPIHSKEEGFGSHLVEREDNSVASCRGKGEIAVVEKSVNRPMGSRGRRLEVRHFKPTVVGTPGPFMLGDFGKELVT